MGELADEHPDGWVITQLAALGGKDDIEEQLTQHVEQEFPATEPRVTATVAITIDPGELEHAPEGASGVGEFYPGQLHVLNAGMRARKLEKLSRKNLEDSDPPSRGQGACMVTGKEAEVFGTAQDPLAFYTVQHAEKFPHLSKSDAWRSHSISAEAALLIQSGGAFVDECSRTRGGIRVYTLPYFVDCSVDDAIDLHRLITGDATSIGDYHDQGEELFPDAVERLRFYVIGVRNDSGDINVLFEEPSVTAYWPRRVAQAHTTTINTETSTTFDSTAGFAGLRGDSSFRHLGQAGRHPNTMLRAVVDGTYARDTLERPFEEAPVSDDPREWLTQSLLTGQEIPVERLLSEYVARLEDETDLANDQYGTYVLYVQIAQLEALARAGLLVSQTGQTELTTPPRMHDSTTDTTEPPTAFADGGTPTDQPSIAFPEPTDDGELKLSSLREYRLARFIDERPALADNPERRGVFLAGVLLGQLAHHQRRNRDMNQTLRDMHPAHRMTGARLSRLFPELISKSSAYATEMKSSSTQLFSETIERLIDAVGDHPPSERDWALPVEDIRFHFAVGTAYGADAQSQAYELRDEHRPSEPADDA
ncbi:TM1802 family CRISPR-associated protein [Halosegnis marinus]|uniref:TM1802 family CRISPR-associated protein n=1 Tax=Halosegnis marinus TaxID=3034023 RepID=UPI00360C15C5